MTLLGQYHAGSQTKRLYDELSFDFYYHDNSVDWRAPTFLQMQSGLATDTVTVTIQANDASGIHAIVVAYTDDGGAWESVALSETDEIWATSWPGSATTQFFIQMVDNTGNMAVVDKNRLYFQPGDHVMRQHVYLPLVIRGN